MEAKRAFRCPSCRSGKYTSLPFGNVLDLSGSASTYRCLRCGVFFSAEVPLYRKLSTRTAPGESAAHPLAHDSADRSKAHARDVLR